MLKVKNKIVGSIKPKESLKSGISSPIVYISPLTQEKTAIPTKELQEIIPDNQYTGLNKVIVEPIPEEYIIPDGMLPITENTTYDVRKYARVSANVHPTPNLQDKEITPTKETQTVMSDEGYDGLNNVTVNAIPNEYIIPSGVLNITENGIQDVTNYAEVSINIEGTGDGSEPVVEPDYITDGLISWWEGEDGFDANGKWNSRVGTDYISVSEVKASTISIGTQQTNPPPCGGGAVFNTGIYGMVTQQDYCVQNYTIQAVGCVESSTNSSGTTMNMLIAMNMGASPMIGVNPNKNAMFANGNNLTQSASYNVAGKTFSGTLYLYNAPARGNTSSPLNLRCSVNGSDWFTSTASSSTHASKGNNMTILCYYEASYKSCGAKLYSLRVYNRELTLEELQHNYEIDKARFNIEE